MMFDGQIDTLFNTSITAIRLSPFTELCKPNYVYVYEQTDRYVNFQIKLAELPLYPAIKHNAVLINTILSVFPDRQ